MAIGAVAGTKGQKAHLVVGLVLCEVVSQELRQRLLRDAGRLQGSSGVRHQLLLQLLLLELEVLLLQLQLLLLRLQLCLLQVPLLHLG